MELLDNESFQQIVEISKIVMAQHNEPPEQQMISKVMRKMSQNKDISKQFNLLAQCINQGTTEPDNQNQEAQSQLCRLVYFLLEFCKNQPMQKHYDGVEELSSAINQYGIHILKFMNNNLVVESTRERACLCVMNIFSQNNNCFEQVDPKLFQSLKFKFTYRRPSQTQSLTFNEKPFLEVLKSTLTLNEECVNELIEVIKKSQHKSAEIALITLLNILSLNKSLFNERIIELFDHLNQQLWNIIIDQPFFDQLPADLQFNYRIQHLIMSPQSDVLFNQQLLKLEQLTTQTPCPNQFIEFSLQLLTNNDHINTQCLINIIRKNFQKSQLTKQLYDTWVHHVRNLVVINNYHTFYLDLFGLFGENSQILPEIILGEVQLQQFNNLITQIIGQMILKLRLDQTTMVTRDLQRSLIESSSMNPFCLYLFHIMHLRFPQNITSYWNECYEIIMSGINEKSIVLIYSTFQLMTTSNQRLSQKLMHLVQQDVMSVWDVCGVLGYQGAKRNITQVVDRSKILCMAEFLNSQLHGIANILQRQKHQSKQVCMNGFYQIVIFFTNLAISIDPKFKNSTFLRLFETVQTVMCVRNKTLNYNKLMNALNAFEEQNTTDSNLRLYIILIKINYMYGSKRDLKDLIKPIQQEEPPLDMGSEISSEFGMEAMIDEEKEKKFKEELISKIFKQIGFVVARIRQLERDFVRESQQQCDDLIELTLEMMRLGSQIPNNDKQTLPKQFDLLLMDSLTTDYQSDFTNLSQSILSSLYNFHITPFATTLIQLFTHPGEDKQLSPSQQEIILQLRMYKLLLAEMINLDKSAMPVDLSDQEYLCRHYNLYYLVKQQPTSRELPDVIKLFNLDTPDKQFHIHYKRYSIFLEIVVQVTLLDKSHPLKTFFNQLILTQQTQSKTCSKVEQLALCCAMVLKIDILANPILQSLTYVYEPNVLNLTQMILAMIQPYEQSTQPLKEWVGFLTLLQLLYSSTQQVTQVKKRKKSKQKQTMEVEPQTITEFLQYPEKIDSLLDTLRVGFFGAFKKILVRDKHILEKIISNNITLVYMQPQSSHVLNNILQFLEQFYTSDLIDVMSHIMMYMIKQVFLIMVTQSNIVALLRHAIQLISLLYGNKNLYSKTFDMEALTSLFAYGFHTVIQLQRIQYPTLVEQDSLSESLSELSFLMMNFMKHLEKETQEQKTPQSKINHQQVQLALQELLQSNETTPNLVCTYKQGEENPKQHFFKCKSCPTHSNKLIEICASCAQVCHKNHEGLEYDGTEVGFCDCGQLAKVCQVVQPEASRPVAIKLKAGRPSQIYERYREEMEILKFRDFVHRMENRLLENEEFLPSIPSRHLPSLPPRWLGSGSESDKDIGKESSASSEQIIVIKSPHSPVFVKKKSRSVSISIEDEDEDEEQQQNEQEQQDEQQDLELEQEQDQEQYHEQEQDLLILNNESSFSYDRILAEENLTGQMIIDGLRPLDKLIRMPQLFRDVGGRGRARQTRQPSQQQQQVRVAAPQQKQSVGSDVESLYPSDPDRASVISSSFLGQPDGSILGRGTEIDEELQVYRGISRYFNNRESEVYQSVMYGLQELLHRDNMNDVVKDLQSCLFALCRQCVSKYIDLFDLDPSFQNDRRKKDERKTSIKEKVDTEKKLDVGSFELPKLNEELNVMLVNTFLLHKAHVRTEPIELFNELKRQQDHLQQRQQMIQVPFQIRHMLDYNGENLIALASQTSQGSSEIRVFDKQKLLKSLVEDRRSRGSSESLMYYY